MVPEYNLYIDQGTTFSTEITITDDYGNPVDLSSATFAAQARRSFTSTTAYPFTISFATDGTDGAVLLTMTATQTGGMAAGRYVYDADYSIGAVVIRFLRGTVTVFPSATQLQPVIASGGTS
jgi:hypothetical protein